MMKSMKMTARNVFFLACILALVGCAAPVAAPATAPSAANTAPTQDVNLVRTEAAQTVVAQITYEAAMNPSATPEPAVAPTEAPTQPPLPTVPPLVVATATKAPGTGGTTGGSSGGTTGGSSSKPNPTATTYVDQAYIVSTTPEDGLVMPAGRDFDVKWVIKNTGRRDWNTDFYIKPDNGRSTLKMPNKAIYLTKAVGKGDTYKIVVDFNAPKEPGTYVSYWRIYNDDGVGFYGFYFSFAVK